MTVRADVHWSDQGSENADGGRMKRLIPYAGAERRAAKQARSTPARATAAPISDPSTVRLTRKIRRARGRIRDLQAEIVVLERMLQKIRKDRGAIT
jgi:hypothetical protein